MLYWKNFVLKSFFFGFMCYNVFITLIFYFCAIIAFVWKCFLFVLQSEMIVLYSITQYRIKISGFNFEITLFESGKRDYIEISGGWIRSGDKFIFFKARFIISKWGYRDRFFEIFLGIVKKSRDFESRDLEINAS